MSEVGITGYGGYIPRLRLSRKSVVMANAWIDPGLMAYSKGERAVCDVDEDSVTMAVEAARDCLRGAANLKIDSLYFSSTTMPFADRQNSTIVAEALALPENLATLDITSSQRAGTSGLLTALRALNGGSSLLVAADSRRAKAASVRELLFGDGAAALTLGSENLLAKFIGGHSLNCDFVDHFRGWDKRFDRYFEQRWIRDEGYFKLVPEALTALMAKTGLAPGEIDHFIMPCLIKRVSGALAKKLGINPEAVRDDLSANCGETGCAHPILMLAHALEEATPGQKILVVGFGQGVDALLFETMENLDSFSPHRGVNSRLSSGAVETNYQKYLSFKDMVEVEWGLRAEAGVKARPSASWREHRDFNALIGARCTECGTVQFPIPHICVNPECRARQGMEEYRLADSPARVASYTVDHLAYTPHPPLLFGMIEFEDGAKFMMQFTECDEDEVEVGLAMEAVFRIKTMEKDRGLPTYFWKAAPRTHGGKEG